ncbi:hypothetical protein C4D60_Mb09t12480 [Musa balbisiana]|uniref:Uncharacterized protein n=1 Tax=Musa balbisiana TaxID=52838 RepID=A0A4S8IFV8_MUSBA|nr:hypothetical protein C4D60_Mb09t12480 [Musa balbisiana]
MASDITNACPAMVGTSTDESYFKLPQRPSHEVPWGGVLSVAVTPLHDHLRPQRAAWLRCGDESDHFFSFVSDISTPGCSLCRNKGTASLYVADARVLVWPPRAEPPGVAVVVAAAADGELRLRPDRRRRRRRARMMKTLAILCCGERWWLRQGLHG